MSPALADRCTPSNSYGSRIPMLRIENPRAGGPAVPSHVGRLWPNCNAAGADLRALQRPQAAHGPFALMDAASIALQPRLRAVTHIARQEIAAGEAVLAVGTGDRRDRAARAGAGVFP